MLMPTYALIQPNIKERLDLTGFKNITEQTATLARLMNAIFLQNYFQLELATMEDVITEVLDVPSPFLFHTIKEQEIRDTISDMKAFDLLTTIPIDERAINFDGFLLTDTLSKISTIPDLSAYAKVKLDYSMVSDAAYQAAQNMNTLVSVSLNQTYRSNINVMQNFFEKFVNSTVTMVECLKDFHENYEFTLYKFTPVKFQLKAVNSIVSNLKAFQQVANHTFLKSLTEKLESLKLYTPILESWVNPSHRERVIRQASVMHELLRRSDKTFDEKILIGLPNGWRDLAGLSQDFKKEWLKQVLHDGKSLNALETLLAPMKKLEKQLLLIEKVWHEPARSDYLNCIHKFLKSLQGLDDLKSTNISKTLPNAIAALDTLSSNTKYVNEVVDEFDQVVKSCDQTFESLESDIKHFNAKKDDPYFFNDINNISSAYPVNEAVEKQLEYLDNLPYQYYSKELNFTSSVLFSLKLKHKNITDCIPNLTNFWKKLEKFRPTFELAFNPDVKDVANVLRAIRRIVPFTEKERSNIVGLTHFLLAAKTKLSESKKLDAVLQQEMKHVDVNRMLSFSSAREIASRFAHYHRTLVFCQKPEVLKFFHNFRSNGLELARKIGNLPLQEKRAVGQIWNRVLKENETEYEKTIINFLETVVVTEKFFSKNYSRPKGNLSSLAEVLVKLDGITIPAFKFKTMSASIETLKITSLGQSEEVSNAERSLTQLEGVYSSLAFEKYQIGGLLEDADQVFKSVFTEQPPEDGSIVLLITAVVAYLFVFVAVLILCCVIKWEFKISDVKQQK
uniref:WSN domain-containing protein n=1 Tax=Caenorhabditis japonica TaxID=281687 RepID=A0A8R1HX83_CAEJA